jgi:ubiquinone/menaquinone biosynthesis C-methylase UbiE
MSPEPSQGRREVRRTYDRIADHFDETRASPWPEVSEFVDSMDPVARALDIGCGNGRHGDLLSAIAGETYCLDASASLLGIAHERTGETVTPIQGDAGRLPLRDEAIDVAVYVATLHHLPSREARVASLRELARVLRPGGRALVSVWSTAHDRFDADEGFDTTVDWTLPDGETVPRYYHIYDPEEFEDDIATAGFGQADTVVSSGNCYATVQAEGKHP